MVSRGEDIYRDTGESDKQKQHFNVLWVLPTGCHHEEIKAFEEKKG